jgi:hypothetical protein
MIILIASIIHNPCGQLYAGIMSLIHSNIQEIKLAALRALWKIFWCKWALSLSVFWVTRTWLYFKWFIHRFIFPLTDLKRVYRGVPGLQRGIKKCVYVELFTRTSLQNYPDKSGPQVQTVYLSFILMCPNTRHVRTEVIV